MSRKVGLKKLLTENRPASRKSKVAMKDAKPWGLTPWIQEQQIEDLPKIQNIQGEQGTSRDQITPEEPNLSSSNSLSMKIVKNLVRHQIFLSKSGKGTANNSNGSI